MYTPPAITPSKNEVDPLPLFGHGRRPPSESGKVTRNAESRSLHQGVQELEIKLVLSGIVFLHEPLIHLDRRYFPRYDPISPRVNSSRRAVKVPRQENGTFGRGGFVSAPDQE